MYGSTCCRCRYRFIESRYGVICWLYGFIRYKVVSNMIASNTK